MAPSPESYKHPVSLSVNVIETVSHGMISQVQLALVDTMLDVIRGCPSKCQSWLLPAEKTLGYDQRRTKLDN